MSAEVVGVAGKAEESRQRFDEPRARSSGNPSIAILVHERIGSKQQQQCRDVDMRRVGPVVCVELVNKYVRDDALRNVGRMDAVETEYAA